MTYLELVAAVGSVPMDIACMYFNGRVADRTGNEKCDRLEKGRSGGMFLSAK